MKKFLSVLGVLLMTVNGFGCLILLVVLLQMLFSGDLTFTMAASFLLYLALFAGLFYLGYRLRVGKKEQTRRPKNKAPEPSARPQTPPQPRTPPQPQARPAEPAPAAQPAAPEQSVRRYLRPVSSEDTVRLCRNDRAETEAAHTLRSVFREVRLELRQGEPALVCDGVEGVEHGMGKFGVESRQETHALPPELRADLTPKTLESWVRQTLGGRCEIPWEDRYMRWKLERWCGAVRRAAGNLLPAGLYPVDDPFAVLEDIGPDGLKDESGIDIWARVRWDAKLPEIIAAFAQRPPEQVIFVLTDSSADLSGEDRRQLDRCHVHFGYPTAEDRVKDLVDGREYKIRYQEWPGSADDAATCGRWWLEELPPVPETRLYDITGQILADCRELGVTEERIQSLLRDGLSREAQNTCSQLSFDEKRGEYVVYYWEKGSATCSVADSDPLEFRFLFLRDYVYHITFISKDMRDPEAAAKMLRETRRKFGRTKAYRASRRSWEEAFGPLTDGQWYYEDFSCRVCPALFDFSGKEHFFGDLLGSFTDLHPREYFSDEWARNAPTGRFVILVNERCCVYDNRHCVYENPDFTGAPDSLWRGNLPAYRLYAESIAAYPELWNRTKTEQLTLAQARETAERLSFLLKTGVCVARTVEDYNRF